jgi:hypothetical protein
MLARPLIAIIQMAGFLISHLLAESLFRKEVFLFQRIGETGSLHYDRYFHIDPLSS